MPIVTMIAGPNGSGKSTLTTELERQGIEFGEYLNADDISRTLMGSPAENALEGQAEVRRRREAALVAGRDHCFETVMSHVSHVEYLQLAKDTGFEIRLFFVATEDPLINEGRVANRVLHGGHDVPRDRIAARYNRCLANLPSAVAVADHGLIFDNSSVEQPFWLLARIKQGQLLQGALQKSDDGGLIQQLPKWWLDILPLLLTARNSIGNIA